MKGIKWLIETQILTRMKCENEVEMLNQAKHSAAMESNWYRVRYERYREVLKIIATTSIDEASIDLAEKVLYKEFNVIDDEPCHYCNSIKISTSASPRRKYKYCPMCGRNREVE